MNYKNLFNLCVEHSDNLFILLSKDMIILDVNSKTETILKWKKEDVCHHHINDIFEKYGTKPFIKTNSPIETVAKTVETIHEKNDLTINWELISAHDEDHEIFVIGQVSQLGANPLDNILKYAPGLVYWKDVNSVYQGCNDEFARLAGLESRDQVVGKTDFDLIWKDEAALYVASDQPVLKTGKANLNVEEEVATAENEKLTMISNKVPLLNNKNQVIGIMGITTDITAQKMMEEDLRIAKDAAESADRAKTEFIANMSHDIKTPLSGVVGMSQLLIDNLNNPEQKQYAQWVHESGEQLLGLLNGTLDIIAADNIDESTIHEEFFDLRKCISDIIELEHPTTHMKGLDLRIDIEQHVPKYIKSDRTKLHRILLNLLGNAIKFTDKGYVAIEVKLVNCHHHEATIRFSVVDTGIGISKEHQDKVFDRFHRAVSSYKGVYAGHGVGLHIAQTYASLLGSTITLESELGVGTRFNFELVLQYSDKSDSKTHTSITSKNNLSASTLPNLSNQITSSIPTHPMSIDSDAPLILLVEDSHIALKVAENVAIRAGCRIESAIDGEHALELAKTMPFDLIISDIGLPGISGYEFTQRLREWERVNNKKKVPIIGLTAHAESTARDQSHNAGMNDVFSKPINFSLMQNILTKHVSIFDLEQDNSTTSARPLDVLGLDLPETEEELFNLDPFPYLDIQTAKNSIGDEHILRESLQMMMSEEINRDIMRIEKAHANLDWIEVEKLAHKIKGGAIYIGTVKMKYACQYLERYQKAGLTKLLEPLYQQLITVVLNTQSHIRQWLVNN